MEHELNHPAVLVRKLELSHACNVIVKKSVTKILVSVMTSCSIGKCVD